MQFLPWSLGLGHFCHKINGLWNSILIIMHLRRIATPLLKTYGSIFQSMLVCITCSSICVTSKFLHSPSNNECHAWELSLYADEYTGFPITSPPPSSLVTILSARTHSSIRQIKWHLPELSKWRTLVKFAGERESKLTAFISCSRRY